MNKVEIDDDSFQGLEDLNAKLVRAVPNQRSTLYNIKKINLPDAVPSIVLAYDLYESDENEIDIIKRNLIRKPGFVSGEIEVLVGVG